MNTERYAVVFRHIALYYVAKNLTPDMHDGPFETKEGAMLAARATQLEENRDPNFVLDLTNVEPTELTSYLR